MVKKLFFFFFNLAAFSSLKAEIIVEYNVTPHKSSPFIDVNQALPSHTIIAFNNQYARIQNYGTRGYNGFEIYNYRENVYYHCVELMGNKEAYQLERNLFESLSESDTIYNVLGMSCRKAIAKKENQEIEVYYTDAYGIGFHPNIDIPGIPLLYIADHEVFGKITYAATSIRVQSVVDQAFSLEGFKVKTVNVAQESKQLTHKTAPKIRVRDTKNEKVDLAFSEGQITVLNFWFKGCKPCIQEIPYLNALVDSLENRVDFIAISLDDPKTTKEFLEEIPFKYQHYSNGSSAAQKFRVSSYPTHIVINDKGKIVYRREGYGTYSIINLFAKINQLL